MKRLSAIIASLGLLGLMLVPAVASADVNNFTITNFRSDQTLTRADKQGELRIVEHINVTFTDNNHGLLRAIPDRYKQHSLQLHVNSITSSSSAPVSFTTYGSNGNTVLKIGNPNQTVTGAQEYTIDYTLRNVISFYNDHAELYWNVNGTGWSQPFDSVSATLHMPKGLQLSLPPNCYTGSFGAIEQNCLVTTPDDVVMVATTQGLLANQTLTYTAAFEPGYFTPSTWYETALEYGHSIIALVVPVILIGGLGFVWWLKRGRDPKGTNVIIPQYDAPDNLRAMEVSAIYTFQPSTEAITATIVDLAIRGYLKIIETKKGKLIGKDTLSYSLELVNADYQELNSYEVSIMQAIFSNPTPGQIVALADLKHSLYATADSVRTLAETNMKTAGYIRPKSFELNFWLGIRVVSGIAFAVIATIVVGLATASYAALLGGCLIGTVILIAFIYHLPARTAKGVAANEHIKGLKLYLEVAEKDRLEKLQGPNAAYASNAAEPVKTVELFEKLLPYAMVLGVEKQWGEQFAALYTTPPGWYSGNFSSFNAYYLATSLNAGIGSAVNTAFSAPQSSSSSGFGGGGFSGGGGGGGGGGGW